MNSFFDEISKKLSQTGQEVVNKTKELAEITKINSQISDEQKKLNKLYMKLGQLYYQIHKDQVDGVYVDICQAIGGCLQNINRYEMMLNEIKGIKQCDKCQTEMPDTSSFCQTCGNKLKDEREMIVSTICPDCGMENGANANTCIKCGKLL